MLGLVLPWWWRWAALGALAVACMGFGAFKMHEHDQKAYDELAGQYAKFKADVAAAGEAQEKRSAAIAAHDELLKEEADNDHQVALAKLRADVERVRRERDRNSSGLLSAAPASPGGPDIACFDRPAVERAYGELVTRLRGLADEGASAVIDLDTAKRWAQKK